jgi:hypothetical protein
VKPRTYGDSVALVVDRLTSAGVRDDMSSTISSPNRDDSRRELDMRPELEVRAVVVEIPGIAHYGKKFRVIITGPEIGEGGKLL